MVEEGLGGRAEATAERIRQAARAVFAAKGYDAATTREIADRAGINIALINRYFGSKLGLFEAAVLPYLSLRPLLEGPREAMADRLAGAYLEGEDTDKFDAFVVLLRSITSAEAGPPLRAALEREAVAPLAAWLGGPEAEARALVIATQLAGLIFRFRILGEPPADPALRAALHSRLSRQFEALIRDEG